jgi:xanthine dehydrogenase/oxidase
MPCNDLSNREGNETAEMMMKLFSDTALTTELRFFINSTEIKEQSVDPRTTVLEYLRANGLTGTKTGCNEGACGACTVVIADYDHEKKLVRYRSANACIMPLCSAHNKQIITIEGLGTPLAPHPIQVPFHFYFLLFYARFNFIFILRNE